MVEHAAVNRVVVGSSPTSGASFQAVENQRRLAQGRSKNGQLCSKLCSNRVAAIRLAHYAEQTRDKLAHCSVSQILGDT